MKRLVVPALALVLAATPALVEAQARQGGGGRGLGGMTANPVAAVVAAADSLQLSLSADQRTRLQAIATQLTETNAPRIAQIQGAATGGGDLASLAPVIAEIQAANTAAIEQARGVLNPDQLEKANPFFAAVGRGGGGGRGGARGGGGAGAPG